MDLQKILNDLYSGSMALCNDYKEEINKLAYDILSRIDLDSKRLEYLKMLLEIGNITYNNTDLNILPIEDGIYDLLLEQYKNYYPDNFQIGAAPITFKNTGDSDNIDDSDLISPLRYLTNEEIAKIDNMLFPSILNMNKELTKEDLCVCPVMYNMDYLSKRNRNTAHEHPELVGTLDKCKYVLDSQAMEKGVFDVSNVKIFERDFFRPLLGKMFDQNEMIYMIATIKYDGISIEADVTDEVLSARTRGDTGEDIAADLTPILKGYKFPNAKPLKEQIGMKFEAIMTYENLEIFNKMKGYNYKNARTAIIGLFGSSDAYKYRDLITLVPLQTSITQLDNGLYMDRLLEIEFMNKFYCRDQLLRFQMLSGNYINILFQIKKFVEEAEYSRSFLPFMYDGVVLEFYDNDIRKSLGRENSVNKYAMAIKFNALKKQTIFRKFTYTVGQNGSITPMIHYDPVEFLGTIHPKSTGSSYQRFCELDLNIGDIIDVEYTNDVMPYVTKPENTHNINNHKREKYIEEMFPVKCPSCNSELQLSSSGKSMVCVNINCPAKTTQRMSNMLSKLFISDFSEESIKTLGYTHFYQLMTASVEDFAILGNGNKIKLYNQLVNLKERAIEDYKIIGALGFTDIAMKTWRLIFNSITLRDLYDHYVAGNLLELKRILSGIKGIGPATINTIINEFLFFIDDIIYILNNMNTMSSIHSFSECTTKIRFSGFRDSELINKLNSYGGVDADENAGVTKDTSYLIVPYDGYNQGKKVEKAIKYGVTILSKSKLLHHIREWES